MNSLLNKKTLACVVIILPVILFSACGGNSSNSDANKTNNNVSNTTASSQNTANNTTNNTTNNSSSANNNTASNQNNSNKTEKLNNSQKILLEDIKEYAKQGKVINCDFEARENNLSTVEEKWGKADSSEWITAAKGMYSTYSKHNIVFGSNKGARIFEIRSFDSQLKQISISMLKQTYGTPQYDVKGNGEEIVGYTTGTDFKLLFVFPQVANEKGTRLLKHYSVLYPKGTVNTMASDPGREW